jgi:hypothetical protein
MVLESPQNSGYPKKGFKSFGYSDIPFDLPYSQTSDYLGS